MSVEDALLSEDALLGEDTLVSEDAITQTSLIQPTTRMSESEDVPALGIVAETTVAPATETSSVSSGFYIIIGSAIIIMMTGTFILLKRK